MRYWLTVIGGALAIVAVWLVLVAYCVVVS